MKAILVFVCCVIRADMFAGILSYQEVCEAHMAITKTDSCATVDLEINVRLLARARHVESYGCY